MSLLFVLTHIYLCFLAGMQQQLNIVHAPMCGSLWEVQCLMVDAAEQVPFEVNKSQTRRTRDPDGGSFYIWMRSLRGKTVPTKFAMQLDIRLYINQLPVNERLRMTAILLPIMSLLTEQWDHVAVTVIDCLIDKRFPNHWFIVQAFADASLRKCPLFLPSNTEWRGKYLFNTIACSSEAVVWMVLPPSVNERTSSYRHCLQDSN